MIRYCAFETQLGWVALASRAGRLSKCVLPRASRDEAVEALDAGLPERAVEDDAAFGDLPDRLRSYFEGKNVDFTDVVIDLDDQPEFLAKALSACRKVPYGTVVTYRDLARLAGSEKACRAAGNAMARNPLPRIVPCHRVMASNGGLGGFAGGLDLKRKLLKLEGMVV